ncbi:hypothetical protein EFO90_16835 [Lactiplantibacillus plantarum]|uniref:transposase n=1 Tax=Lactiplantibacillus plantarum TaxID=1590 RepID=UPI0035CE9C28|nr:hypothetical protein [Lactiplantibacillus plantarum]MCT3270406.1 hypothetical protein [Lactiplantibacillus plantarum]
MVTHKISTNRYSEDFKNSIVALHQTGHSTNSLVKKYNVSVSNITKWVKQTDSENADEFSKYATRIRKRSFSS